MQYRWLRLTNENTKIKSSRMFKKNLFSLIAVNATGSCEIVFRLTNGKGIYQWIRGKARTLFDKNEKPECVTADNVLLT